MNHVKTFQHHGKQYEINLAETETGWNAAVFCDGKRMSGNTPIHRDI